MASNRDKKTSVLEKIASLRASSLKHLTGELLQTMLSACDDIESVVSKIRPLTPDEIRRGFVVEEDK